MPAPIRPQPGIMDIALYRGGASTIAGVRTPLKLSSNENPFGPSPGAVAAMRAVLADLHRYPSTSHAALRGAIARIHGLDDPDRIIIGVGSDELLSLLAMAYAGPGDQVLFTEHGFAIYRIAALAAGATPVAVPEAERVTDTDAILARITPAARLVYIANPNNPTGTMISMGELVRLADGVPEHCLLVLDGAYAEYVPAYDGGAGLVKTRGNVVMTRTFSKIYGLGGLRVGWGYAPRAVIDVLNRIRGPFNMSAVALAGAEAAVHDQAFVQMCHADNLDQRTRLAGGLAQLGIPSDPSFGNFVLARFTDAAQAIAADAHLKSCGIIVRPVGEYGFPEALRITVGRAGDVARVLRAMATFRGAAQV
ncbi:MAG: histidinol-phosphate transaminase [Rhodobacteraceae bacterium]|nr:histidinol-phosphate transaminase [Paracoccaceae bacterium]